MRKLNWKEEIRRSAINTHSDKDVKLMRQDIRYPRP